MAYGKIKMGKKPPKPDPSDPYRTILDTIFPVKPGKMKMPNIIQDYAAAQKRPKTPVKRGR
jgi:hypothetical protein